MTGRTMVEQIFSAHAERSLRAGDIAICHVDRIIGTDGSGPMAIDYFDKMAGARGRVRDGARVCFSLDHYAPPNTPQTKAFHERIRRFADAQGATVFDVGEGISHQVVAERGLARPGNLILGADSHTVMLGALNCAAVGVGSSDLAAAMMTGQGWLRVPETICVRLHGALPRDVSAKDLALELVSLLGADGADYHALEFSGSGVARLDLEDRFVVTSLMVEGGAKVALFPCDEVTREFLDSRGVSHAGAVASEAGARFARTIDVQLDTLTPRVANPHAPDNVSALVAREGTPVQMVFVGTCTGGRVSDVHAMRAAFDAAGGRVARGVQLVLTPASREVLEQLTSDGTIAHLTGRGAVVTTAGCGACCGTSGVIPGDGMTVLSTANRNFKGRMGNATAQIYLASPASCGTAAATGMISAPAAAGGTP
jgi:3-isopropylmalate/(R)-2-methylmalate dehydratase large subunit